MPNAMIELAHPKRPLLRYLKVSPLGAMLRLSPWLADKTFSFQATERVLEYPFIHEQVPLGRGRCLDVGSGNSLLPLELASKGYQVWSIDLKKGYRALEGMSNFIPMQGDIRKTDFPNEFFDVVTAVSCIEHVGLGNSNPEFFADREAVREIRRILKLSGRLLMTVPYGKAGFWRDKGVAQWRVYDSPSLAGLLAGLHVEQIEFGVLDGVCWRPGTSEEAEGIDSVSRPVWHCSSAVAMVAARRL
jgi:SAM-dependent methyltransferase